METIWTWDHVAYLSFAVGHPISELIRRIDLRTFLNRDYYGTGREDFPVSREKGIEGSLFVLIILVLPLGFLLVPSEFALAWYLAFGLAVADLIQHLTHFVLGRQKKAPLVHLLTILGVCYFLWQIAPKKDVLPMYLLVVAALLGLGGALIIFWNWWQNSLRAGSFSARPPQPV